MGNLNETYRALIKDNGLTQKVVAERLGYASQATVGKFLSVGVTLGNIYDLAKELGYEVKIVKKNSKGKVIEEYDLEV